MSLDINFTFTTGGEVIITSTIIRLLSNIAVTGSITGSAKASDLSYKRAWDLLDKLNTHLLLPATSTSIGGIDGGGTHLTETGRLILSTYSLMVSDTNALNALRIDTIRGLFN